MSAPHWAELSSEEALRQLGTTRAGLSEAEVAVRRSRYGPNSLPRHAAAPWYLKLAANFVHFFALLLWAAAVLAWVADMPPLAVAIVLVIVVNGLFSYWQEHAAERATEALQALLPTRVLIRRANEEQQVAASELVPGDILLLEEGEAVPADARLLASQRLRLDASTLTGESRPIARSAEPVRTEGREPAEIPNLVFAGTAVASGRGEAVVFATGATTEFGRIAHLTQSQHDRPSPLQQELVIVTRIITTVSVSLGVLAYLVGTTLGGLSANTAFIFALGIIVANVPEGLLPTLTLSLALGVRRMAQRNALVKRLSSVEALGATTVILTDKTGTLTENEMTVRQLWLGGRASTVSGVGYEPVGAVTPPNGAASDEPGVWSLLRTAALCCDARLVPPAEGRPRWGAIGDSTEAAILVAAAKAGLSAESLAAWPRLSELPFDSLRKRMTTIQSIDGRPFACVKGAPSEIVPRCTATQWDGFQPMDDFHRDAVDTAVDRLTRSGLRVLAVATREVDPAPAQLDGWRPEDVERDLTFLGLLAMEDPPRPEVPAALASCQRAGIRVVLITGDDPRTATTIGREIGLFSTEPHPVLGSDLERMPNVALDSLLDRPEVLFARVTPEQKLRLVQAFQRRGEIVAVTGDGVNDAPALKQADVGVAMGATGTDVAREAADMVLADDNFANIVHAIREGRAVFDNVRKFTTYVIVSNVAEAMPFVFFVLFHVPLPLTVMQILAVDVGTDLMPALTLGMEPPEGTVMDRPPRSRSERLLNRNTLLRAYAWLGLIEGGLALLGFAIVYWQAGWRPGDPLAGAGPIYTLATTMTLSGIVAGQVGVAFACRSPRQSVFRLGFFTNRALFVGIAFEVILLGALIYVPPLAAVFELAPVPAPYWLLLLTIPPLVLLLEEARKALAGRGRSPSLEATSYPQR